MADTNAVAQRLSSTIARGFVGQDTPLASSYHSQDYDWQQHAEQTAPLVEAQWAAAPAAVQAAAVLDAGQPISAVRELLLRLQQQSPSNSDITTSSNGVDHNSDSAAETSIPIHSRSSTTAPVVTATPSSSPSSASSSSSSADNEWEQFYRAHPAARFFKERRYLLLEFPCLAPPSVLQHVVEIGAGCGSSILPVLRAQPHAQATLSDISSTCLQQLLQAMQHLGLDTQRVEAFTADGTDPKLGVRLAGCAADAVLIMFTLSAVVPEGMLGMMCNAAAALRPGGLLCIRDHALYDMVSIR